MTEILRDNRGHIVVKKRCIASQFNNTVMFSQKQETGKKIKGQWLKVE